MITFLPLFPLQVVVFPGELLNLHIFEERYKQLVTESWKEKKPFGITAYLKNQMAEFGTEVEILAIEKTYEDGRMDIRTKGTKIFRLIEFMPKAEDKLYPAGIISYDHHLHNAQHDAVGHESTVKILKDLVFHLSEVLKVSKNLIPSDGQFIAYRIAHYLGMPIEEEYNLLLDTSETARQERLIRYIRSIMPDIEARERVKEKIAMNGHFKHLKPPDF